MAEKESLSDKLIKSEISDIHEEEKKKKIKEVI